eukprot:2602169-Pyramimonas_sp.AAC.1
MEAFFRKAVVAATQPNVYRATVRRFRVNENIGEFGSSNEIDSMFLDLIDDVLLSQSLLQAGRNNLPFPDVLLDRLL